MGININRLTLGEVAKIEELSGMPISAIGDDERPKGNALAALAFVTKRRTDPKFTWNQAQGLTFDEAQEILGLGEDVTDGEPPAIPGPEGEAGAAPLDKAPAKKAGAKATTRSRSRKTPASG